MQAPPPSYRLLLPHAHSNRWKSETSVGQKETAAWRKISSVWQCFDEEKSDYKVVCRLFKQKLAYNKSTGAIRNHIQRRHLDANLRGEQATTRSTQQTSITITPQKLWCRPLRKDNVTRHWNDCLWSAATVFCWRQRLLQVNALYWAWIQGTQSHKGNIRHSSLAAVFFM